MADRYFVDHFDSEGRARISGDEAHHLLHVMRRKTGDSIMMLADDGREYSGIIDTVGEGMAWIQVNQSRPAPGEPQTQVILLQGLCKGEKMDWVIQKATELGALALWPVSTSRSDVKLDAKRADKKNQRWERIAREAAKQARRGRAPEVAPVRTLEQVLREVQKSDLLIALWEEEKGNGLRAVLQSAKLDEGRIFLLVGPEGGLTAGEARMVEQAGGVCASLGSRILRTETAGLCGLSCIMYERGELG